MNNKEFLKKQIEQTELQIKKLNYHASTNELCEELYNSLILKKAVLKKELEEVSKNPLIEKVKKVLPRREKLICDYFS